MDPAGLNGELNYYSYASDNSISHSDISGLKVFKCCRDTQINKAIDNTLHLFGLKHCFLKTDSKEAGMGPLGAGPLPSFPILTPTEITNHTGQSLISNCKKMKCVDETCVNQELQIGKHIGEWSPWNNCNTFVDEILEKCHQDHATCCDE